MGAPHTWLFARHGRSEANEGGWLSGHHDVALTAQGRDEARALGSHLGPWSIQEAVSSDLQRAVHTRDLALASAGREVAVRTDARLRERDCGAWTGKRFDAIDGLHAVLYGWFERPPGGESLADVAVRAARALADLERPGGVTLVVAHGGTLRALLGLAEEVPVAQRAERFVANAALHPLQLAPGTWARLAALAAAELAAS